MSEIQTKLAALQAQLKSMGKVLIAFSGGVDSTFLLALAHDLLGEGVTAVTARSSTFPHRELSEAISFTSKHGIKHIIIDSEELDVEGFANNPVNRCYLCKKELFGKISMLAEEHNIKYILDGSNADDLCDYRPGLQALAELGILSPLKDAGMTKEDIRTLSREMKLPSWDKPSFACLSSRFPYGEEITPEKLSMVDKAEDFLLNLGFKQVRVRHHGNLARIEVSPNERSRFFDEELMSRIDVFLKEVGFTYVTLDLKGYRTGSMNETL